MDRVCKENKCVACMACVAVCPKDAITIKDSLKSINAVIDEKKCIQCNACTRVCQQIDRPIAAETKIWKQGWVKDPEKREKSSSGGLATAISQKFIENGGQVYACTYTKGQFTFECADNVNDLEKFTGSKYVKSNPGLIYREIRNKLKNESRILFIGLPCQVAGLKKYIGEKLCKNLYTIDLICHGTPSKKLLEIFLKERKMSLRDGKNISFRDKGYYNVSLDGKSSVPYGVRDRYTMGFLKGLMYTENCYECQYAQKDRISDLTLGDSWGSELAVSERLKGISLILCQNEKGKELMELEDVHFEDVDAEKAIAANHQLRGPSQLLKERETFFHTLRKNKNFHHAVFKAFPRLCFKQDIKQLLINLHLLSCKKK